MLRTNGNLKSPKIIGVCRRLDEKPYEKFNGIFKKSGIISAADFIKQNKSFLQKVLSKIIKR